MQVYTYHSTVCVEIEACLLLCQAERSVAWNCQAAFAWLVNVIQVFVVSSKAVNRAEVVIIINACIYTGNIATKQHCKYTVRTTDQGGSSQDWRLDKNTLP